MSASPPASGRVTEPGPRPIPAADSNTVAGVTEGPKDDRMPRGVLVIVAIGLLACVLAAVLTTDKGSGEAAELVWVQSEPMPDSKVVDVPGGGGTMQLTGSGIRATGTNASGYSLYRVISILNISAGSPVGSARIYCAMTGPSGAELAQTPSVRAAYPRSSEELFEQEVPEVVLLEFSALGAELATVPVDDFQERFSTQKGVKLEWPEREEGRNGWKWFLPPEKPSEQLVLPFAAVWKSTAVPAATVSCTLETSSGKATVRTAGALKEISEPLVEDETEEKETEEAEAGKNEEKE